MITISGNHDWLQSVYQYPILSGIISENLNLIQPVCVIISEQLDRLQPVFDNINENRGWLKSASAGNK